MSETGNVEELWAAHRSTTYYAYAYIAAPSLGRPVVVESRQEEQEALRSLLLLLSRHLLFSLDSDSTLHR